ncbi:uncharacterized [Tachysurus ichikawai]
MSPAGLTAEVDSRLKAHNESYSPTVVPLKSLTLTFFLFIPPRGNDATFNATHCRWPRFAECVTELVQGSSGTGG